MWPPPPRSGQLWHSAPSVRVLSALFGIYFPYAAYGPNFLAGLWVTYRKVVYVQFKIARRNGSSGKGHGSGKTPPVIRFRKCRGTSDASEHAKPPESCQTLAVISSGCVLMGSDIHVSRAHCSYRYSVSIFAKSCRARATVSLGNCQAGHSPPSFPHGNGANT